MILNRLWWTNPGICELWTCFNSIISHGAAWYPWQTLLLLIYKDRVLIGQSTHNDYANLQKLRPYRSVYKQYFCESTKTASLSTSLQTMFLRIYKDRFLIGQTTNNVSATKTASLSVRLQTESSDPRLLTWAGARAQGRGYPQCLFQLEVKGH